MSKTQYLGSVDTKSEASSMQRVALESSQIKRGDPGQPAPSKAGGPINQEKGDKCIASW